MPKKEKKRKVFSLRTWLKTFSVLLVFVLIFFTASCGSEEQKECCLCSSFRYHAPCLIDLKNGELIELDLYFPHETKVAELADIQPQISTFSFVHLGNAKGTKITNEKRIEIDAPISEKETNPALCEKCRKQLNAYSGRYVLADLYSQNEKRIIVLDRDFSMTIRCYEITAQKDEKYINITIQGIL